MQIKFQKSQVKFFHKSLILYCSTLIVGKLAFLHQSAICDISSGFPSSFLVTDGVICEGVKLIFPRYNYFHYRSFTLLE